MKYFPDFFFYFNFASNFLIADFRHLDFDFW